jgi:hypothetical protein
MQSHPTTKNVPHAHGGKASSQSHDGKASNHAHDDGKASKTKASNASKNSADPKQSQKNNPRSSQTPKDSKGAPLHAPAAALLTDKAAIATHGHNGKKRAGSDAEHSKHSAASSDDQQAAKLSKSQKKQQKREAKKLAASSDAVSSEGEQAARLTKNQKKTQKQEAKREASGGSAASSDAASSDGEQAAKLSKSQRRRQRRNARREEEEKEASSDADSDASGPSGGTSGPSAQQAPAAAALQDNGQKSSRLRSAGNFLKTVGGVVYNGAGTAATVSKVLAEGGMAMTATLNQGAESIHTTSVNAAGAAQGIAPRNVLAPAQGNSNVLTADQRGAASASASSLGASRMFGAPPSPNDERYARLLEEAQAQRQAEQRRQSR